MMPCILAKRHASTLAHFAASNVLVAFDFDGTLAAITARPERARMRRSTRALLSAVARSYPCIVISGREWRDIAKRVAGVPLWHVFGNHGLEPWAQEPAQAAHVRHWVGQLRSRLAPFRGVFIEDKIYSVTIHYRGVRRRRAVLDAISRAVADLPGLRAVGGKAAVNLLPGTAPHKGAALEHARRILACDCAIYVGDDDTDEDAFAAAPADRLLSIRVGRSRASQAAYTVNYQRDVDALLRALIAARPSVRSRAS
jgi:trehalose 6-phosphate phosphatase